MWCFSPLFSRKTFQFAITQINSQKNNFFLLNEGRRFFLRLVGVSLTHPIYYSNTCFWQHTAEVFRFFLFRSSNGFCLTSWSRLALINDVHTFWALLSACFFFIIIYLFPLLLCLTPHLLIGHLIILFGKKCGSKSDSFKIAQAFVSSVAISSLARSRHEHWPYSPAAVNQSGIILWSVCP